jgi:cytochrome c-type biogenesis protein CcmH
LTTRTAVALIAIAAAACGERPAPPPPIATPEAPPMRPLSSRDGQAPSSLEPGSALPPGHPAIGPGAAAEGPAVEGEIRLDPRIRDQTRPGDVLFVIARNAANRQVVAVRKEEGARFPFSFRLSSGDAMMPGTPFEGPFDITARLSRSGDAIPQAGDLEGTGKGVAAGSRGVTVVIDTIRP